MDRSNCRPETIRRLDKAEWHAVNGMRYWVINAEHCYGAIQESPHGFESRIFGVGDRIPSCSLGSETTLDEAKQAVEDALIQSRQLGLSCHIEPETGVRTCTIKPLVALPCSS